MLNLEQMNKQKKNLKLISKLIKSLEINLRFFWKILLFLPTELGGLFFGKFNCSKFTIFYHLF